MAVNMACELLRPRLVMAVSLPIVGYQFLSTLQAGSLKVHPRELDIYKEPEEVQYEVTMEEPTALEENVSKVRKVVWKYKDDVKDVTEKTRTTFKGMEEKTFEFVDLIQKDRTFQMKVGGISVGVVTGALLAGRGRRPFRRLFFAVGLGTVAASICYPKEAVDITLTRFEKLKDFVDEQRIKYNQSTSLAGSVTKPAEPEVIKPEETGRGVESSSEGAFWNKIPFLAKLVGSPSSKESEVQEEILSKSKAEKDKIIVEVESKNEEENIKVEGDTGMSNPEDKDLYSTRS